MAVDSLNIATFGLESSGEISWDWLALSIRPASLRQGPTVEIGRGDSKGHVVDVPRRQEGWGNWPPWAMFYFAQDFQGLPDLRGVNSQQIDRTFDLIRLLFVQFLPALGFPDLVRQLSFMMLRLLFSCLNRFHLAVQLEFLFQQQFANTFNFLLNPFIDLLLFFGDFLALQFQLLRFFGVFFLKPLAKRFDGFGFGGYDPAFPAWSENAPG
jgi:hypothetical protein